MGYIEYQHDFNHNAPGGHRALGFIKRETGATRFRIANDSVNCRHRRRYSILTCMRGARTNSSPVGARYRSDFTDILGTIAGGISLPSYFPRPGRF